MNFFTSTWSQLLLAASGVHLNVVGGENLTAQRPAVFLFNHRNQADPVITADFATTIRHDGSRTASIDPRVADMMPPPMRTTSALSFV